MIIAIVNHKGGVGKTTTAVNLSAALAEMGRRVRLLDLDGQASASLSLGVARAGLEPSSADVLFDRMPIHWAVRPTRVEGLSLVTGSEALFRADLRFARFHSGERRLMEALLPVREDYDFIFIDCPPSLSLLTLNALVASDAFLVPVAPLHLSCEGLDRLLAAASRLKREFGIQTAFLGIILTLVDARARSVKENIARIRGRFKKAVLAPEVRSSIRLAEAPALGKTIFEHDRASPGAAAYQRLASELLKRASRLAHRQPLSLER